VIGFFIIPGEPEEVRPERPLIEALIKEGDEIVTKAEAIEPTNASVIEFRRLVEQAKAATTPEARRQALIKMEALEDEVKSIAKAIPPPAVEEMPHTLPLEQVSKLETRIPLDLIRKDEVAEIERLTKEIQKEGIKEPIIIRVREDGSRIVWDGIHRLIVAQNLGIKNVPVQFIGEVQRTPPGNPTGKLITKEEAIGLLERLSMTPEEAARSLIADEAERREIMRTVQERVKREQNKWAPMDPREGPPLPRIFAGLKWPWRS